MSDWESVKARLSGLQSLLDRMRVERTEVDIMGDHEQYAADIRAALERVEELERERAKQADLIAVQYRVNESMGVELLEADKLAEAAEAKLGLWERALPNTAEHVADVEKLRQRVDSLQEELALERELVDLHAGGATRAETEVIALRQRVEELEGQLALIPWDRWKRAEERVEELEGQPVIESEWQALVKRADAAEAKLAEHMDGCGRTTYNLAKSAEAAEAEVARLRAALAKCVLKRRGDNPGMSGMADSRVADEVTDAYIARADSAARAALRYSQHDHSCPCPNSPCDCGLVMARAALRGGEVMATNQQAAAYAEEILRLREENARLTALLDVSERKLGEWRDRGAEMERLRVEAAHASAEIRALRAALAPAQPEEVRR